MGACDPQQWPVYRWEWDLTGWAPPKTEKPVLRAVIKKACALYRVPVPEIRFARTNTYRGKAIASEYDPSDHSITLRPRHFDPCSALHEASHGIVTWILGHDTEAHGREFLGVQMVLLDRIKVLPRSALEAHAKEKGLAFCSQSDVGPTVIRRRYARLVRKARLARTITQLIGDFATARQANESSHPASPPYPG